MLVTAMPRCFEVSEVSLFFGEAGHGKSQQCSWGEEFCFKRLAWFGLLCVSEV